MPLGNGVNLQPSYYNNGDVDFAWSLMRTQSAIRTVRIEIEPDKAVQARGWIQQAAGHGYAVIATYHKSSVLGSDSISELMDAAAWWAAQYRALLSAPAMYTVKPRDTLSAIAQRFYGDASQYRDLARANRISNPDRILAGQTLSIPARARSFIINVMNEWGSHALSAADYANAYNGAIAIVRRVYSGPLIVDAPGWGQETAIAASAVKGYGTMGGAQLQDPQLILSAHIYRDAFVQQKTGTSSSRSGVMNNADLEDLASAGVGCMVGEFGIGNAGAANWSSLVDHAKSLSWPVLGWAWNGDGGTMNMVTPRWPGPPPFTMSSYASTILSKL